MRGWLKDGTLLTDTHPVYYLIEDSFTLPGEEAPYKRWGIIGRVRLEPFESGRIFPHERTHQGPKEDRLALMKPTRCNLSPVFGLYTDPEDVIGRRSRRPSRKRPTRPLKWKASRTGSGS